MPKSGRRSDASKERGSNNTFASDHDYSDGAECTMQVPDDEEFPPLPITPSKPPLAKKPAFSKTHCIDNSLASDDAVLTLANLINSRSDALEKMVNAVRTEIKVMNEKIILIEKRVEKSEEAAEKCMARVADLESYGRRWNLRLQGLPETEKENVRAEVISVCQNVLPSEKEKLPDTIDVAHRVGRQRQDDLKPRGVIIRFISRRHKEELWKAAKNCAFLQSKGLRFTEDLSKEDRENRQRLWPKIKKARDEGKTAYFVGGRGFINGSEIHP